MKRFFHFSLSSLSRCLRQTIQVSGFISLYLFLTVLFFNSCGRQPEIPIKISRLEQSMFTVPIDSIQDYTSLWEEEYGDLFNLYCINIICIGSPKSPNFHEELTKFITHPDMNFVFERVMEVFPDLNEIESGLGKAFYNYNKAFPDRDIPSVYTLMSGLNESMIVTETAIAIALDKYLGKEEEIYFRMDMPNYMRQVMDSKYIVRDCMENWISTEFPFNDSINNLLANIIYKGKIMYALHKLIPEAPDSLIFGFTPNQMRWCYNNTDMMWRHLVENKMLFITDNFAISKLINPAPFSFSSTRESPGRAVTWLGYRIVTSYMKRNKVTLEALLKDDDYQKILEKARFKP